MALKPQQLSKIPKSLVEIYEELENFIIDDISRRIAKAGTFTDTTLWQVERAKSFGIAQEVLRKKIKETLKLSDKEVDRLFKNTALTSIEQDNVIYEQAKLTPIHLQDNKQLQNYLSAAAKQTKGELKNISKTLGFCTKGISSKRINKRLTKTYIDTMDFVQMQVSSGVIDYQTAVRQAVKKLCDSGIRVISYDTGWHNRVDVAVRRATLSGVNAMTGKMTSFMHDEIVPKEEQYVETTAHAGARPSHQVWQGRVFKVVGSTKDYPNFQESTHYGSGDGIMGWNCRHNYFPFIPDISERTYTDEQLENIDPPSIKYGSKIFTYYEATQEQRKLETKIRAVKRELIGYSAINDKEAFATASIKLQMLRREYEKFSNKAGLSYQKERTGVYKFNKSLAQKAVWANRKGG